MVTPTPGGGASRDMRETGRRDEAAVSAVPLTRADPRPKETQYRWFCLVSATGQDDFGSAGPPPPPEAVSTGNEEGE